MMYFCSDFLYDMFKNLLSETISNCIDKITSRNHLYRQVMMGLENFQNLEFESIFQKRISP